MNKFQDRGRLWLWKGGLLSSEIFTLVSCPLMALPSPPPLPFYREGKRKRGGTGKENIINCLYYAGK